MNIPPPLFFDSFLFNGEEIVKLRLAYLAPYVDRFYITESLYTFSGKKKDGYFIDKYSDWFAPYLSKITFLRIGVRLTYYTFTPTGSIAYDIHVQNQIAFREEKAQRNWVREHLRDEYKDPSAQKFVLAVADVDEIYDLRSLGDKKIVWQALEGGKILFFKQRYYMLNFNYFQKDDWCMAFLINSTGLLKYDDLDLVRVGKVGADSIVIASGWHLTYCMSKEEIKRKLQSYSHMDNNNEIFTNPNYIDMMIRSGRDLFMRKDYPLTKISFDNEENQFPAIFRPFYDELCRIQDIQPF